MSITIFDIHNNAKLSTAINLNSKAHFSLMQDDYVVLNFSLPNVVKFAMGDYFDYERVIGGNLTHIKRYEVVDLITPKPNASNGGYDYELRLDAYYYKWRNKIFKFFTEASPSKETSFSITATPSVVMSIFLRNLADYGFTYYATGAEFTFDTSTLAKADEAKALSFNATSLLDALNAIAEAWECEWWVTENIIHLGKCEHGDTFVPLFAEPYGDQHINVAEMSQSGNRGAYATRLFVYGSERNIPSNYRKADNTEVVNAVVKKRLMLPESKPFIDAYKYNSDYSQRIYLGEDGYDDAPNLMPVEEAIEGVITLDEVYPRSEDNISNVEPDLITDTIVNEDGSETKETWTRYRIKLDKTTGFRSDYILPGETLRIAFEGGKLNGMDFDVAFNPDAFDESDERSQVFEIIRNEDYGRKLPDDVLRPEDGDKVVLYNWDVSQMLIDGLGYIAKAEEELYKEGVEQLQKQMVDPNNYTCRMMSDVMLGYDCTTHSVDENKALNLEIGQRVLLVSSAYFNEGERKSRIIGYEYNLDKPWDNPVYTVGETASVGRLSALESKVEQLTIKGIASTQASGNVIYVIGSTDKTRATDTNVYSALRTNNSFARKDLNDVIQEVWKFYKYIQSKDFNSGVLGYGWFLGYDQFNEKGEGINSHVEVDTLKIRKKAMFDTLEVKHVSHVGGELILSPAGATISNVTDYSTTAYRCFFRNDDGTDVTVNQFAVGDLIMCKTFNLEGGQRYYWRRCTGAGVSDDGMAYIDLSKRVYDRSVPNDIPMEGDAIVVVGNDTDSARSNAIVISSYATGAPSISLYQGIDTFELTGSKMPVRISPSGNKFTGKFYIQILADDGSQQVMSLAEFLEGRISLGVNERLYGDNAIGDNMVAFPTEVLAGSGVYSRTYTVNQEVASTWKAGDEVVFRFVFMPIDSTSSLTIGGGGVLDYMFDVINLSDEIRDGMSTISGRMTCKMTFAQAQALAEENEDDDRSLSVIISARGLHEQGELTLANGYSAELKRTGVDIERGYIKLDARTTTIKDGEKELAIFTTDTNGNAKLSTELIDADAIEANRLSTKGNTNSSGNKTDYIHIEQSQMQVYDANGLPKVKVHSGTLISDSSSGVATAYSNRTDILSKSASKLLLPATSTFYANNSNKLYKFSALTGYVNLVLTSVTNNTQFVGFPALNIDVHLYYSPTSTSDINSMLNVAKLASFVETWDKGTTGTKRIEYIIPIQPRTLSVGYYRVVVKFSIDAPHDDSTASITGNPSGITSVIISQLQEIASNGYHFSYGDANMPVYQKGNASDGFVMMYDKKGIKVDGSGAWFKQDGDVWSLIGSGGGGGGDTPSVVVPSITITATETSSGVKRDVDVTKTGSNTAPVFDFAFKNLKGDKGDTPSISISASVGNGTTASGSPTVNVNRTGEDATPSFAFAFNNLRGAKGDTGVGISSIVVDYAQMGISETPALSTSWSAEMPRPEAGKVIWTRIKITKTDATTTTAYTKAYQGDSTSPVLRFGGISAKTSDEVRWNTNMSMVATSYADIYYFSEFKIFAYAKFNVITPTLYPMFSVGDFTYLDYQDGGQQGASIHKDKLYQVDSTNEIYCWKDDTNGLVLIGGGGQSEVVIPDVTANAVMLNPGSLPTILDVTVEKTDDDAVNFAFTFPDLKGKDGSDAEVGVMPKGDSTGEYVPIVANFTNIYSPASAPSTAQYYTRNGEYINEAYGGLAYITYNNIVVSQVIPLSVGGVTLYPVMIAEAISKGNNNYTAWEQCYVTIALVGRNPVITNIFNSSKTQISPSILSRCVLKSVVLGSFRK